MESNYGEIPSLECRRDSHDTVDKQKRYRQITEVLTEFGELTAREVASAMCLKGYSNTDERNVAHPRLSELCEQGIVEQKGKKRCTVSGKNVTVYGLVKPEV